MSLADELRGAFLTSGLSDEQREELIAAAAETHFIAGEELFVEGRPADHLWMHLQGEIELTRRIGTQTTTVATMTEPGQWAGGLSAWGGADAVYRASGHGRTPGRCLVVPSDQLAQLVERWSPFAAHITRGVFQTVRGIDAAARERQSLVALGELAARLAHEINNPASASLRTAEALQRASGFMLEALVSMAEHGVTAGEYLALDGFRAELVDAPPVAGGALAMADREDAIGVWLENRLDDADPALGWKLAPVLAAAGADIDWLERVAESIGEDSLTAAVRWISSAMGTMGLIAELTDATQRIGHLVEDVKTYSAMDRAESQRVDITAGIDSTLALMAPMLAGIVVVRDDQDDLPEVDVYSAELNQVWTNLIDNAVDAMGGEGTLTVRTRHVDDAVVVEISDTGSGLDADVESRVFEPFFTTKDVGSGTGLGLDISRRIVVDRHGGEITLTSHGGVTTARVTVPIRG